jgi:ATP-binding cassette subfamily B protein
MTPPTVDVDAWSKAATAHLFAEEALLAVAKTDLDAARCFSPGAVALTTSRILSLQLRDRRIRVAGEWPLREGALTLTDHAGVATLDWRVDDALLARWEFRLGLQSTALGLLAAWQRWREGDHAARSAFCRSCGIEVPVGVKICETCTEDGQPPSTLTLLRLWRFARPYRSRLLLGFLLTLVATAATLVPPYLTKPLMDKLLIPYQNGQDLDKELVSLYMLGLLAAALVGWALGWARTFVLARVSERIGADLRTATFEHLLNQSVSYFGSKRTGDLMARIGAETDRINVFLSLHLLDFATDILMIAMTALVLFSINPWLALVTLLPLPVIGYLIHVVRDRLRRGFERADRVWGEVTNVLADTIPGIRVVKAFAQEGREVERFRAANRHNLEINDRVNKVWSMFAPSVTLLTEIGLLVVWTFGIWQVSNDDITVGTLAAFIAYIGRFYTRLDSMSRIVSHTQKAAAGAKRIFDILDHVSNVPEPAQPRPLPRVEGRIQLQDVSFRYGNRQVIRHLNLDIRPGEMIGVVGHSGSGKSTLVNLVCRFHDVSGGMVRVDGIDVRELAVADYRRHIGLVLQEPFLFFGTIAENIAYGRPNAGRAEIVAAARAAHAHDFIMRLPHGYDSLVGERGQSLSGGERQRISIARALLIDPCILILDEATSSVDSATEKAIQAALDNLVRGRTTIAIAHRLSTLRRADRLVVLDGGEMVETGTHDELMTRCGAYYALHQAQARQAEILLEDGEVGPSTGGLAGSQV